MNKLEIDKLSVFWKKNFKQWWFWVYLCSIWEHSCFYIFPKFLSNIKKWKVCQYLALLHQLNIEKIEVVFIPNQSGYLQIKYVTLFQDWVFSFCHLSCFGIKLEYVFIEGLKEHWWIFVSLQFVFWTCQSALWKQ